MRKFNKENKRILVALSGGVDSAVAAWMLQEQGFGVVGVHFILQKGKDQALEDAKKVAEYLGIELQIKDISQEFQEKVVAGFLHDYQQGKTPNPCIICNPQIKFKNLLAKARQLGIGQVATGHYSKIGFKGGPYFLEKAMDWKKDQSYFLYRLQQEQLANIKFPLGEYTKPQIRALAQEACLPVAKKRESQDVCFFSPGQTLKDFLEVKIQITPGKIVDEKGQVLGTHQGIVLYTQGQRFGLGLSGGPFYVVSKDLAKNLLVVTKNRQHPALENRKIIIQQASWVAAEPQTGKKYQFRSRYQIAEVPGYFTKKFNNRSWLVELQQPQWAVAPGQSLVAYDQRRVLGGGIIRQCE